MSTFSWLHLTDLHRGIGKDLWLWPGVRERFIDDLKDLYNKCGPWDLVLFTGDLTQKGSVEEFNKVDEILGQLWEEFAKLNFEPKLLAVPGNHDLVRPNARDPVVRLLRQWDKQPDVRAEFWNNKESPYRRVVRKTFENYVVWWEGQPFRVEKVKSGMLPGDFSASIAKDGAKLGIIGLNTAFLQLTGDDYEGQLALHLRQFHEPCNRDGPAWAKNHHTCLLLTHHPPSWLNSESREYLNGEIAAHGRFAAHLCGHMHETIYQNVAIAGTRAHLTWQSRSLFGLEFFSGGNEEIQRLHGYAAGKIELHENTGTLKFWPRKDEKQGWQTNIVPDFSLDLGDDLHTTPVSFPLLRPYVNQDTVAKVHSVDAPVVEDVQRTDPDSEETVLRQKILTELRQILATRFGASELRTLCFDLGMDYDDLPDEGKAAKARELVIHLERRNRISELVRAGKRLRPDIAWETLRQAAPERPSEDEKEKSQIPIESTNGASPNKPNPFVYGRPVRPARFLDRETGLRTIFNRLRNEESTAIVGEPHIGKSSLLLKLADEATQQYYLGDDAQKIVTCSMDMQPISSDYTPDDFWDEVLEPLRELSDDAAIAQRVEQVVQSGYERRSLVRLFNYLGQQGRLLVLLLDEFEHLLVHPNFQTAAFFALLRSLATRTGGLSLVPASRLSVAKMNERGLDQLSRPGVGSPFFNNFVEVKLRLFDDQTVALLLDRAGDALTDDDRRFIRRVAGRHPFLCQAMAAALVETTGEDRQARAAERFYEQVSFHFDDLWRSLDEHGRTTAMMLSLAELGSWALGQDFACTEIEQVDAFGSESRKLIKRGLAEAVDEGWEFDRDHLFLWHGEQWTVGIQAFVWWIRDVAITETYKVPAYDQWLANEHYRSLLTQEQWDWLSSTVRNMPEWATCGVGTLARSLFEELVRRK